MNGLNQIILRGLAADWTDVAHGMSWGLPNTVGLREGWSLLQRWAGTADARTFPQARSKEANLDWGYTAIPLSPLNMTGLAAMN